MDLLTVSSYSEFLYSWVLSPAVTIHSRGSICAPPRPGRRHLPLSSALHRAQGGYLHLGGSICTWGAYLPLGRAFSLEGRLALWGYIYAWGGQFTTGGVTCHRGKSINPASCPQVCTPEPLICPTAPICTQPHLPWPRHHGQGPTGTLVPQGPARTVPQPLLPPQCDLLSPPPGEDISPPIARMGAQTQHRSPTPTALEGCLPQARVLLPPRATITTPGPLLP